MMLNTDSSKQNQEIFARHPCFQQEARHRYARIHLPVAPGCNMQCNYCNRKYSCVNESRPGVTCAVLRPGQAIEYLRKFIAKVSNLSVVGIAGPGDPLACADETLETLRMVKAEFPHLALCLATNGLNLLPYVEDLIRLGLSHVTLTVNAVDPKIGSRFYDWIQVDGVRKSGEDAAAELWQRQQSGIRRMAEAGLAVKINTIFTPGVNDFHVEQIAQTVSVLGATVLNIMPLLPTAGTAFAGLPEPDRATLQGVRRIAEKYLPQMAHCSRCRADAAGMLGENNPENQQLLQSIASAPARESVSVRTTKERPCIAIATSDGKEINLHLGETRKMYIYSLSENTAQRQDDREIPNLSGGAARWISVANALSDCSLVLVSGAGGMPRKVLEHYGVHVVIVEGSIDQVLRNLAAGADPDSMAIPGFRCDGKLDGVNRTGCA